MEGLMKRSALSLLALLASALPLPAQEPETERLKKELGKLKSDQEVFVQQLELQLKQISELTKQIEGHRSELAKALNEKSVAVIEAQYCRKQAERLAQDLTGLEEKHIEMARQKKRAAPALEGNVPKKAIEAKVTAVASEIGLVVLSVGTDDGVSENDEFTIRRGGEFVAKVVIDRADRKWSAGKVVSGKSDSRVGDVASSLASGSSRAPAALSEKSVDALRDVRKELDEVRRQVRALSDQLLPAWSREGVATEEASEDLRAHLGIQHGLLIRRIRQGSPAEKVGLKALDVVAELTEAEFLDALDNGKAIRVVRQGKQETLGGK
jgi:hypothetical protein